MSVAIPKNVLDDHYFIYPAFTWRALETIGAEYRPFLMRPAVRYVARFPKGQMWLYGRVQVLQAISSAVGAEIARQAPYLRSKVRVLPYPVDPDIFKVPPHPRNFAGDVTGSQGYTQESFAQAARVRMALRFTF